MTPFRALTMDLGTEKALGAGKPFVTEQREGDGTSTMIVVDRDVAFVAQFNNFGSVGLRKGDGIKGVANGARDRGEMVIIDAMILVEDEPSIQVKHATHGG
jgi:hypothetical protein